MIDITVPSRGTRHGKPQRWSIPWWRERARRLTRKQRIRQERQAARREARALRSVPWYESAWGIEPNAEAYQNHVEEMARLCHCAPPHDRPCEGVLAGGFCDERGTEPDFSVDEYEEDL